MFQFSPYSLSFNADIARKIGLNAAIVFNHLTYWLKVNKQRGENFINGRTWMYETIKQMSAFLDFLSEKQVREALQELVEYGLIIKDYHNSNPFNRMTWYALCDESILGLSNKTYECDEKEQSEESSKNEPRLCSKKNYDSDKKATSDVAFLSTSEGDEKATCRIDKKQQKNTQQKVVVGGEPPPVEDSKPSITKDDVYHYALAARTDWQPEEIESAWLAFSGAKAPVNDPYAYIKGIIEKKRVLRENQTNRREPCQKKKTSTKKDYSQKSEPLRPKKEYSNQDMLGPSLAKFDYHKNPKKNS